MARRVARPPKAAFVTRLRSSQLPTQPLVSYQTYRQLSGWNLPPLVIGAIGAHWTARATGSSNRRQGGGV